MLIEQRRQRGNVHGQLGREPQRFVRVQRAGEKFARLLVARAHDGRDAGQAAVLLTQRAPRTQRVAHHRIVFGCGVQSHQGPRALTAFGEQARLAQRSRMAREVRL